MGYLWRGEEAFSAHGGPAYGLARPHHDKVNVNQ